jgi:hypothetical protein
MLVNVSVSVASHVVLSWYLIIGNSLLGQDGTDAKFVLVAVRRNMFAYNIFAETRTIFYA